MPAYWLVDPERRCLEGWTPAATVPTVAWETVAWQPAGAGAPLRLSVGALFQPI